MYIKNLCLISINQNFAVLFILLINIEKPHKIATIHPNKQSSSVKVKWVTNQTEIM
jgi:hypothetical protein